MDFKTSQVIVTKLTSAPTDDQKLQLYALFKQVTVGPCNTPRPGMFDFKAKAKWEKWNSVKDMSPADAEKEYCTLVQKLTEIYGVES